jgi:alpha-glucosidase
MPTNTLIKRPGRHSQTQIFKECFILNFECALLKISILKTGGSCIQFALSTEEFNIKSYAVLDNSTTDHTLLLHEECTEYVIIKTSDYQIRVCKADGLIEFQDLLGNIICADEQGLGNQWSKNGFTCHKSLNQNLRFTGLAGKTGPINKRGRYYEMTNTDHFGYGENSDPLYASIPFFIGINQSQSFGIFLDNSAYTYFDFGASQQRYYSFGAPQGPFRYYFFYGTPKEICKQYIFLSGLASMPPKWALGYQQCRYSYFPDSVIINLIDQFNHRQIPLDVIYLDIHYMDDFKVFTWHPSYFPNPEIFVQQCQDREIQVAVILDPGIKKELGYAPYDTGEKEQLWISYTDGKPVECNVWPGNCVFPDFTRQETREWWASYIKNLVSIGVRGFWNDMNEPAVFGNKFPVGSIMEGDGAPDLFPAYRNVYGMLMNKSTLEGATSVCPDERLFVLTRATFSGGQRFASIWTGDNSSDEQHLHLSTRMVSAFNSAGFILAGSDIGGFIGECTSALYMRWIALGSFQPLFRGHTMINSRPSEPWGFGEDAEYVARQYIQFRYKLMPWWFSQVFKASKYGDPICVDLAMDYCNDEHVYDNRFQNQFICGDTFLVSAGSLTQRFTEIYFPKGHNWIDLYNLQKFTGGESVLYQERKHLLPVFIKEGSFILCWPDTIMRANHRLDTIELHMFSLGEHRPFKWYDDDDTVNAIENEQYMLREISWDVFTQILRLNEVKGNLNYGVKYIKICLHGIEQPFKLKFDNKAYTSTQYFGFLFDAEPPSIDPFFKQSSNNQISFGSYSVILPLYSDEMLIEFHS